ncbi:MAG TPA: heme exporter protein CcmD [Pedomonas sp.]|uniref:heme exporter protein CcmD n=1 Tax=Pedomonas sp. TaxID=2976421 RepID=UPI002F406B4E
MNEFLAMGGYAAFIWASYAAAALGLAALGVSSWRAMRSLERQADAARAERRAERGRA